MTRKSIITAVVSGALVLGSSGLFASQALAQGRHRDHGDRAERHPEIRQAMQSLQDAKTSLQHANRDFGGHRTDAVKEIDKALVECRRAIEYDNHH